MHVIGHRGAPRLCLENTVESLRAAFEEGADGVEFDVQFSGDGELVVWHDHDLSRWGGGREPLRSTPWRVLRATPLVDARGHGGAIAHLDEVLELLEHRTGPINAELKPTPGFADEGVRLAEAFARRTSATPARDWIVSSFDRAALHAAADRSTGAEIAALVRTSACDFSDLATADAGELKRAMIDFDAGRGQSIQALHVDLGLVSSERMSAWRQQELRLRVWTANHERDWERLLGLGVQATITDDPGGLRRFLDATGVPPQDA